MQSYSSVMGAVAEAAIFFDEQNQAGNNREAENKDFLKVIGDQRPTASILKRAAERLAEYPTPPVPDCRRSHDNMSLLWAKLKEMGDKLQSDIEELATVHRATLIAVGGHQQLAGAIHGGAQRGSRNPQRRP